MSGFNKSSGLPLVTVGWHPVRWAVLAGLVFFAITCTYLWLSTGWGASHLESREAIRQFELIKGTTFMAVTSIIVGALVYVAARIQVRGLMERMREQRQITVGIMASAAAHDINNLLQATSMMLAALQRTDDPAERQVFLDQLSQSCQDLKIMAQTMRDFGKESLPQDFETADLGAILRQTTHLLGKDPLLVGKNIEVETDPECDARLIPTMMRQAILNLLLNAAQVTDPSGTIRLTARKNGNRIELRVEDDGPGIPQDKQKNLFAPYITHTSGGTGLGLYSVMAVMELHGGTISVADSPLGGAAFTMIFPSGLDTDPTPDDGVEVDDFSGIGYSPETGIIPG